MDKDLGALTYPGPTSAPSVTRSVAALRKEYRRAYKQLVLTRQEGWRKAVARLNADIMRALVADGAAVRSTKVRAPKHRATGGTA